jgi:glycerophosphoryl diester phosphodiesterase
MNSLETLGCMISSFNNPIKTNKIKIHGHRGARGLYPENTLAAFRYAIDNDVDVLELDLNMTKDNEIIIYHDRNINASICNGISKPIKTLTLKEIKQYDCGSKKNYKFITQKTVPGEKIPSFKELINLIQSKKYKHKKIIMNIEICTGLSGPETSPEDSATTGTAANTLLNIDTDNEVYNFSKQLIAILRKYKIVNNVIIQSFDIRALKYVNDIDPSIKKKSYLIETQFLDLDKLIKILKEIGVTIISPYYKLIDKNIVKTLHDNGFEVLPWTINDINIFKQNIEYRVDGIITDYPKEMKDYFIENYRNI